MELREFVKESLTQIIDGVRDAQQHAAGQGARVNPPPAQDNLPKTIEPVDFDIAVITSERQGGQVGVGIFVGGIGIGGREQNEISDNVTSRIQFSVQVELP